MTPEEATEKLFLAAREGNVTNQRAALNAGADINAKDALGATPLHAALARG